MGKRLTGLLLLCLLALPAHAEEDESDQTVVVTASRSEQERFEAERSVELVDREQLEEAQVRSVPEAVEEGVGVYLQQTNRGSGTPFIRGLSGPQNLILVDGVRFNASTFRTGPNQYLALLDPYALKRIEVVRGPSSVLYGNGAMGGVMQLFTVDPRVSSEGFEVNGRAHSKFSSADLSTGFALQVTPTGAGQALMIGAHFDRFGPLWAGAGAKQPLSNYNVGYWQAKFLHSGGGNWTLTGTYLGSALRDTARTDQAGKGDLRFYDNDDHLAYLIFRWRSAGTLRKINATVSYHRFEERIRRFGCQKDADGTVGDLQACLGLDADQLTRKRRYHDTVDVLGADLNAEIFLWSDRIRINTGTEFYQEFVSSSLAVADAADGFVFVEQPRGNFSDDSRYRSLGVYLRAGAVIHDFGPETGRLRAIGGARFSHFAAFAPDVPDVGDVEYDYNGVVGAAGLQWLRPGIYNLFLSFVQGFRAPNLQETTQMGDTGMKFNIPNPDLKPEKSNTIELGGRANLGPLELSVAGFYSMGTDAIQWETTTYNGQTEIDGKPVTHLVNAIDSDYFGVEGGLAVRFWRMKAAAGATWMRGDVEHGDGSVTPARRIPPFFGTASLRYNHPDRKMYAEILVRWSTTQDRLHPQDLVDARICETAPYSGRLQDPCDGTPGWVTLNLRAGWRIDDWITARLSVNNITDQHYRTHGSGFDAPGFDTRLSLDVAF
jgi:outer membrane receptor protein involved in Fe transport